MNVRENVGILTTIIESLLQFCSACLGCKTEFSRSDTYIRRDGVFISCPAHKQSSTYSCDLLNCYFQHIPVFIRVLFLYVTSSLNCFSQVRNNCRNSDIETFNLNNSTFNSIGADPV